jgi:hypothetical protein
MNEKMTTHELDQRIRVACVDLMRGRMQPLDDESDVAAIARCAAVPVGHVLRFLRRQEISVSGGNDEVNWTQDNLHELEADVLLPISSPQLGSQEFQVHVGSGSQVQVGHHVSGTQSVVTYQQVLDRLRDEISQSAMPEAEKKTALQKLGELLRIPGVVELIKVGGKLIGG